MLKGQSPELSSCALIFVFLFREGGGEDHSSGKLPVPAHIFFFGGGRPF